MYAVFASGAKQYRVSPGDKIKVERLAQETGETIAIEQVLLVADGEKLTIGTPYVKGSKITATVVEHGRGKKINIIKFQRRKHHMKRQGHRQGYTLLEVKSIDTKAAKASKTSAQAEQANSAQTSEA